MQIPIYKPELPPYELVEPEIREMYASGMLYPGKYTERLEEQVSSYCGVPYVSAVTSCSLGLILLLNLLPKGSQVIMPCFTFNATLQALEWNDHTPIVVDVDDNGQMVPDLVDDCLQTYPDVAAVVPVHMWGNACYPEDYQAIRDNYDIPVFFDSAHVFGSLFKGKNLAQFGDALVYSIAATKPVSAGEGGLVVTSDKTIHDGIQEAASHGLVGSLDTRTRGINGKIQEFNSILAYHAINMLEDTKKRRADILNTYRAGLDALPLRIWEPCEGADPVYKDCTLFVNGRPERDRLEVFLNESGIGTKRYFDPIIPDMGSFKGLVHSNKNGRKLADTCLNIPLYPALTESEVSFIINAIRSFFNERSNF